MDPTARNRAMDLLARREHSARELIQKLRDRGFSSDEIEAALEGLQADGLQSDERFAEAFVHSRVQKGMGPLKLRAELQARGVDGGLARRAVAEADADWLALAIDARVRRFGETAPADRKERARQQRFLHGRGFPADVIAQAIRESEGGDI